MIGKFFFAFQRKKFYGDKISLIILVIEKSMKSMEVFALQICSPQT